MKYDSKVCKNDKTDFSSVHGLVYTIVYPHEIRSNCVFLKRNCEWSNTRKTELYVHLKNKKIIKYKLFHLFTAFSLLHFCFLNHSNYIVKLLLANVLGVHQGERIKKESYQIEIAYIITLLQKLLC